MNYNKIRYFCLRPLLIICTFLNVYYGNPVKQPPGYVLNPLDNIDQSIIQQELNLIMKDSMKLVKESEPKSLLSNYVLVNSTDPNRISMIKDFYSKKILENLNIVDINLMYNSNSKTTHNGLFIYDHKSNSHVIGTTGSPQCNLDKLVIDKGRKDENIPVCPWHTVVSQRTNRYPFRRSHAHCNCENCLATTDYDFEGRRISKCIPNYTLKPCLVRIEKNPIYEKWLFALEKVANSCICSLSIKLH